MRKRNETPASAAGLSDLGRQLVEQIGDMREPAVLLAQNGTEYVPFQASYRAGGQRAAGRKRGGDDVDHPVRAVEN